MEECQDLGRQLANMRKGFKREISREFKRDNIYRFYDKQIKRWLDKTYIADLYVELEGYSSSRIENNTLAKLCEHMLYLYLTYAYNKIS